jgi:acyl-CoA synthetase (AMP-forming)/AMP-acid ligase II
MHNYHLFKRCLKKDTRIHLHRMSFRMSVQEEPVEANRMEVGEIWLAGSSKCLGYWNQPELTKQQFQSKLVDSNEEWLRTGDLGFILNDEI